MGIHVIETAAAPTVSTTPLGGIVQTIPGGKFYLPCDKPVRRADNQPLSDAYPRSGQLFTTAASAPIPDLDNKANWIAMASSNTAFVAVAGRAGMINTDVAGWSRDGRVWACVKLPANLPWSAVAFGAGLFVAIAPNSRSIITSPDGQTWTERPNALPILASWNGLAYTGAGFIAVSTASPNAAYSANGIAWSSASLPTNAGWAGIAGGNGKVWAVATGAADCAVSSNNGQTWAAQSLPPAPSGYTGAIAFGNGVLAILQSNGIITSNDNGSTWQSRSLPSANKTSSYNSLAFGNGVFIATGDGQQAAISSNGVTWEYLPMAISGNSMLAYVNGTFATGRNCLYAENTTDSEYLYLPGPAGHSVRAA